MNGQTVAADKGFLDLTECRKQPLNNGIKQHGVGLHDLTHKENNIIHFGTIIFTKEVHNEVHHRSSHFRVLHDTDMDCLHQHLVVLTGFLKLTSLLQI
jgi:hypothetical protein